MQGTGGKSAAYKRGHGSAYNIRNRYDRCPDLSSIQGGTMPIHNIDTARDNSPGQSGIAIDKGRRDFISGRPQYTVTIRCGVTAFPAYITANDDGMAIINVPAFDLITGQSHSDELTTKQQYDRRRQMGTAGAMPGLFINDDDHMAAIRREATRFFWQAEKAHVGSYVNRADAMLNTIDTVAHGQ